MALILTDVLKGRGRSDAWKRFCHQREPTEENIQVASSWPHREARVTPDCQHLDPAPQPVEGQMETASYQVTLCVALLWQP